MKIILWLAALFIVLIPLGYYFVKPEEKALPILNPIDLNESTVDPEMLRIGYGHTISDFQFTNQRNELVSSSDFDNQLWVAEYFFTTCGSICPMMNKQLKRVQEKFKSEKDLRILSFTVDPETDSSQQLRQYGIDHGVGFPQWQLLTGKKEDLYQLARKSFFLLKPAEVAKHGDGGCDFIHTNNFVLIDRKKRIRSYYDGTSTEEVDQLIHDIELLLKEGK